MAGLFYVDALPGVGELVELGGAEGFHAATVRRLRVGEQLTLGDGAGVLATCAVVSAERCGLSARVLQRRDVAPAAPSVTVVQALPKSERSELAVELATEAGADGFVAWAASRCVARWEGARAEKGLRRWRAVARAAAAQSRRAWVPEVSGVWSTGQLARWAGEQVSSGAAVLVLHESASAALASVDLVGTATVALLVGPEGGVSDDEIAALVAVGARAVRLGPTVLRTSTAAAVALGALGVLTGRWGG